MARYGDLDELKLKVQRYTIPNDGSGMVSIEQAERWFLKLLDEAPTADVAPKSEVAREIFEEIEKYLLFNAYDIALISHKTFDVLKKKYTEEK